MLKRKIWKTLLDWKERNGNTALAILGARQVGKSTTAREFGRNEFEQLIEINFIDNAKAKNLFKEKNAKDILQAIEAYTRISIIPGKTLILLDEIQECPAARTAIKFLVEEGSCRYIETGSLLGVNFSEVQSYPVGFEETALMFPLDFEEYLWGLKMPEHILLTLKNHYDNETSIPESVHQTFLNLFYTYLVVGGMPEVVQSYVDNKNLLDVYRIQKNIIDRYRLDVTRYAPASEKIKILSIFDQIPSELDNKNKRFMMSSINKNARVSRYENTFLWLEESGIGLACYNTSAPIKPLEKNAKRSLFKLFLCDTGLLCAFFNESIQLDLIQGAAGINSGSILENSFAQALRSKELPLFYYDSKKIGELDFVVQNGSSIDIFEIKSGNNYKDHKALNNAMKCKDWKFRKKIIFCKGNIERNDEILYLPWYLIMFYEKEQLSNSVWDVDFSELLL